MEVLQQERAVLADALRLVWVRRGNAIAGGVDHLVRHGLAVLLIVGELSLRVGAEACGCAWSHGGREYCLCY